MYKAIIFDFFDVIHRDPFHEWLRQSGLKRGGELHEASQRLDLGLASDEEHYQELGKLSGQSAAAVKAVFDDTSYINSDLVELIKHLKRTYKIGLLSNTSTTYLRPILQQHDLESLFDNVLISAEVGLIKPDPAIFRHMAQEMAINLEDAVFVDDNPANVQAAESIGLKSLVYKDVKSLRADLQQLGVTA